MCALFLKRVPTREIQRKDAVSDNGILQLYGILCGLKNFIQIDPKRYNFVINADMLESAGPQSKRIETMQYQEFITFFVEDCNQPYMLEIGR